MKPITKEVWSRVVDKALEIGNAAMRDDFLMVDIHKAQMLELLDELEAESGLNPKILVTRATF